MVDRSAQRLDWDQWLVAASAGPVLAQFWLVCSCPLGHESLSTGREPSDEDRQALDVDGGLIPTIAGMKVRASAMMRLVVVHPDHYAVEGADPRHQAGYLLRS